LVIKKKMLPRLGCPWKFDEVTALEAAMPVFWEKGYEGDLLYMNSIPAKRSSSTHVWIPIGVGLFLVALAVSAVAVPQLRLLHLLQAFIYVAIVILARRNNVFALGAGFTIAVAWNCLEFFGPQLIQAGAVLLWTFLHTGQVRHVETMMVPLGGIGHLILIFACLTALFNQTTGTRKWWKFLVGGVLVLGYFALIVAIARLR
jgi:hypothetical protein